MATVVTCRPNIAKMVNLNCQLFAWQKCVLIPPAASQHQLLPSSNAITRSANLSPNDIQTTKHRIPVITACANGDLRRWARASWCHLKRRPWTADEYPSDGSFSFNLQRGFLQGQSVSFHKWPWKCQVEYRRCGLVKGAVFKNCFHNWMLWSPVALQLQVDIWYAQGGNLHVWMQTFRWKGGRKKKNQNACEPQWKITHVGEDDLSIVRRYSCLKAKLRHWSEWKEYLLAFCAFFFFLLQRRIKWKCSSTLFWFIVFQCYDHRTDDKRFYRMYKNVKKKKNHSTVALWQGTYFRVKHPFRIIFTIGK